MDSNRESASDLRDLSTHRSLLEPGRQGELCLRYRRAIRAYLGVLLHDEMAADDLGQEIAVKMLQGRFSSYRSQPGDGADAPKGRFRDYLRTAVRNAVRDHWERMGRRPTTPLDDEPAAPPVDPWRNLWRRDLVARALAALKAYQDSHPGNVFHLILCLLGEPWMDEADHAGGPGASVDAAAQLAVELSRRTGRPYTSVNACKQKERARRKFTALLIEEIQATLEDAAPERIADELHELGLMAFVQDYLPAGWPVGKNILSP